MRKPLIVIAILAVLMATMTPIFTPGKGQGDFLAYWAAARLMISGGNPYDLDAMTLIQEQNRPNGETQNDLLTSWNPPWLSLILIPFAGLPFQWAAIVWMFTNILLVGLSILITLDLSGYSLDKMEFLWSLLTCLFFGETIALLNLGQIGSLVLLSVLLSVRLIRDKRDWLAGGVLLFSTIKPHLVYLVLFFIFLWVIYNKRWSIVASFLLTGLAAIGISSLIFPGWIPAYLNLLLSTQFGTLYTSTIGSFFSNVAGIQGFQYLGVLSFPLAIPLLKNFSKLGWVTILNIAWLVSVSLGPYGFTFDQVVLLPTLVQMVAWLVNIPFSRRFRYLVISALVSGNLVLLAMLFQPALDYYWFFWTPFFLLFIYIIIFIKVIKQNKPLQANLGY